MATDPATNGQMADADVIQANLDAISEIREEGMPGWTRRLFSDAFNRSRPWLVKLMSDVGLDARMDAALNVVGVLPGADRSLRPIVVGSHTDTVAGGGRYDGIIGVIGAIELARQLSQRGVRLNRDLRIVDFAGEEANDFGISCIGSRALTGKLDEGHLALRDTSGRTLREAIATSGGDPDEAIAISWAAHPPAAYFELHIEQGPVLEKEAIPIGVVTGIVGIHRATISVAGRPDHAGTMPMNLRADAACAAAEVILAVEALPEKSAVATTGRVTVGPGASNVVPGAAELLIEIRSDDAEWLWAQRSRLESHLITIGSRRGVDITTAWHQGEEPVPCAPELQRLIAESSESLGYRWRSIASGAGHDAVMFHELTDIGMVFVPCLDGRSHVPEEFATSRDIAAGVDVLARSVTELDASLGVRDEQIEVYEFLGEGGDLGGTSGEQQA